MALALSSPIKIQCLRSGQNIGRGVIGPDQQDIVRGKARGGVIGPDQQDIVRGKVRGGSNRT